MSPKQRQNLLHSSDWLSFLYYICHGNNNLDFIRISMGFQAKSTKEKNEKG